MAFPPFDLTLTFASGQTPTFTFEKTGPCAFRKINTNQEIWQEEGKVKASGISKKKISRLFRLHDDTHSIYSALAKGDPTLSDAVYRFSKLRLTRSDPWETTVCFLISQNNHFSRISQIVRGLHGSGGMLSADEILCRNLEPLKMGYREAYLKDLSRVVIENGFSFKRLEGLSVDDAREELVDLPGIGSKVADCILVYGFAKPAFPIDVWVRKAMEKWYGVRTDRKIQDFSEKRWGRFRDYAQQLLFWKARSDGI